MIVFRACWGVPCRFWPVLIQCVLVTQDLVPVGTGVMTCVLMTHDLVPVGTGVICACWDVTGVMMCVLVGM